MSDESFIPWEQIEPLLRSGMQADDLKRALCAATGLDPARYVFVTAVRTGDPNASTLFDELREGLWVMKRADMEADQRQRYIYAGDHRAPSSVGRAQQAAAAHSPQDASGPTAVAPSPEPRPQEGR